MKYSIIAAIVLLSAPSICNAKEKTIEPVCRQQIEIGRFSYWSPRPDGKCYTEDDPYFKDSGQCSIKKAGKDYSSFAEPEECIKLWSKK